MNLDRQDPKAEVKRANYFYQSLQKLDITPSSGYLQEPRDRAHIRYHLFPSENSSVCSILFHGTGNDGLFAWESIILGLIRSGRSVFSFDLSGHGQNSSTCLRSDDFLRSADFLGQELPRLLPEVQSFEAIGYSLGAKLALHTVLQKRLNWTKLVVMALPDHIEISPRFVLHELLSGISLAFWQQLVRYGWRATLPSFGSFRRKSFPIRIEPSMEISYPKMVAQLLQQEPALEAGKNLEIPTLLIYGKNDWMAPLSYGQQLAQHWPHSTLAEIKGANHFLLPLLPTTEAKLGQWL